MGAVIWDLNIGLLVNAPLVAAIVAWAVVVRLRQHRGCSVEEWLWPCSAIFLLGAFAQSMNINHGGTPGMSRYALWLIPLFAPLVDAACHSSPKWQQLALGATVAASSIWNVVFFNPAQPEGFLEPTAVALYQWRTYPGLLDPLPEIFAERVRHQESANPFAAVDNCAKALLQSGQWPRPCATTSVPVECRPDGVLCYANRNASGTYDFHVVSRRGGISLSRSQ